MTLRLLYSPFPDRAQAKDVAHTLLQERHVACVNVLPGVSSYYYWEGTLQEETEVILLAKTSYAQAHIAVQRLEALHPYECPCVLVLPTTQGNDAFTQWVQQMTGPQDAINV